MCQFTCLTLTNSSLHLPLRRRSCCFRSRETTSSQVSMRKLPASFISMCCCIQWGRFRKKIWRAKQHKSQPILFGVSGAALVAPAWLVLTRLVFSDWLSMRSASSSQAWRAATLLVYFSQLEITSSSMLRTLRTSKARFFHCTVASLRNLLTPSTSSTGRKKIHSRFSKWWRVTTVAGSHGDLVWCYSKLGNQISASILADAIIVTFVMHQAMSWLFLFCFLGGKRSKVFWGKVQSHIHRKEALRKWRRKKSF